MPIVLILGPMFGGKTTELLRLYNRERAAGKKAVLIKNVHDTRYDHKSNVFTHDGSSQEANIASNNELMIGDGERKSVFAEIIDNNYSSIFVDEGQFFKDIDIFAKKLSDEHQRLVVVAALDGNYQRVAYPGILSLIPYANSISKFNAVCMNCQDKPAPYTIKLHQTRDQDQTNPDLQEHIGGSESYKSVCESCRKLLLNE